MLPAAPRAPAPRRPRSCPGTPPCRTSPGTGKVIKKKKKKRKGENLNWKKKTRDEYADSVRLCCGRLGGQRRVQAGTNLASVVLDGEVKRERPQVPTWGGPVAGVLQAGRLGTDLASVVLDGEIGARKFALGEAPVAAEGFVQLQAELLRGGVAQLAAKIRRTKEKKKRKKKKTETSQSRQLDKC